MGLRDLINQHRTLAAVVIVAIAGLAVLQLTRRSSPDNRGRQDLAWFYLLDTGQLIGADRDTPPPVQTDAGKAVRAAVFDCGTCDRSTWFIGYLETYDDAARAALAKDQTTLEDDAAIEAGYRIAPAPDGGEPQWIAAATDAGTQLLDAPRERCNGNGELLRCRPDHADIH